MGSGFLNKVNNSNLTPTMPPFLDLFLKKPMN